MSNNGNLIDRLSEDKKLIDLYVQEAIDMFKVSQDLEALKHAVDTAYLAEFKRLKNFTRHLDDMGAKIRNYG